MSYQQQQPMFNFQQISERMMAIQYGNPPYCPQYQGTGKVASSIHFVVSALMISLQEIAANTPNYATVYTFNQMASNGYNNNFFSRLVNFTGDLIAFSLRNSNVPIHAGDGVLHETIKNTVPKTIGMFVSLNLNDLPMLATGINPAEINYYQQLYNEYNQCVAMLSNGNGGMQSGFVGHQFNNQQMPNRAAMFQQGNPSYGQMNNQPVSRYPNTQPLVDRSGLFHNSVPGVGRNELPNAAPAKVYPQNTMAGVVAEKFNPATTVSEPVVAAVSQEEVTWFPSEGNQYCPAYNPLRTKLRFVLNSTGNVTPIIEAIDMASFEYDQHSILNNTVFGPIPRKFVNVDSSAVAEIAGSLRVVSEELADRAYIIDQGDESELVNKTSTFVDETVKIETSLAAAWLVGDINRLSKVDIALEYNSIYRIYANVCEPVISRTNEQELVKYLGASNTFKDFILRMKESETKISPTLFNLIDKRITKAVNSVIANNLSIPNLDISSFYTDIEELVTYLKDNYGVAIRDAFVSKQKTIIFNNFIDLGDATLNEITQSFADMLDEGQVLPELTYLSSLYSLTYINHCAHELEIELLRDISVMVTPLNTPVMYALLVNLFKDADVNIYPVNKYLIKTQDGRIMEASRGYVGNDVYLLSIVE